VEDVIAVEVQTDDGRSCYFITWGRIQDRIDPEPVESVILAVARRFATPGKAVSARLCESLQEARDSPLFYEALLSFAHHPIPFGRTSYPKWRRRIDNAMRAGREIYFTGPFARSDPAFD
jgi:hypothetical protein